MITYNVYDPNETLKNIVNAIKTLGVSCNSRNGMTLAFDQPVSIRYVNPRKRVIWLSSRDANPFFHIFEFVWMLNGRKDVKTIAAFNGNMRSFSDDGETFNAPYGYRLRKHFKHDQLEEVISILKTDLDSRQAVALLWDHEDLTKTTKDKACNLELVFKVRKGCLDMTVFNRSNDLIWGAMGANLVHMSFFHEYIAYRTGIPLGVYEQVSNCLHVYTTGVAGDIYRRILADSIYTNEDYRICYQYMNVSMKGIDEDTSKFFRIIDSINPDNVIAMYPAFQAEYESEFFRMLFIPMMKAYYYHKNKQDSLAKIVISDISYDWKRACHNWLNKRS